MIAAKKLLLSARNALVRRSRLQRVRELSAQGNVPNFTAFYHRVANTHPNGWTISNRQFRRHLNYFQSLGKIVDLAEAQRRVQSGESYDRTISITFDDGYADNLDFALPEILSRKIPCTYFVSTQHFLKNQPFQHDIEAGVRLPVHTAKQIRELSDSGIEIGCHTRGHVDFSKVDSPKEIRSEIQTAKDELEQVIGRPVRYFAFPYGLPAQLTGPAIQAVHDAGFDGFCSAYGGYNLIGRDAFHLRRFHGDPEFPRLVNWLSYDESKVKSEPQVIYQLAAKSLNDIAVELPPLSLPNMPMTPNSTQLS